MRIALTGGIACGKSLVAKYLNEFGEKTVTFEPPILPGLPQLFYKVETVQKK